MGSKMKYLVATNASLNAKINEVKGEYLILLT